MTFTSRRDTPLYRRTTPSRRVAEVLSAVAEGLTVAAAGRGFGHRRAGACIGGGGCTGAWIRSPAQLLADVPRHAPPTSEAPRPSPTLPPHDPIVELLPFEPPIIDDPAPTFSPTPSPTVTPDPPSMEDPPIVADPPGLPAPPRVPSPGPWTVEVCIRITGEPQTICQEFTLTLTEHGHLTVVAEQEHGRSR